jgi:hypothetical protein
MSFSGFTDAPRHETVANDGWFPDMDLAELQTAYRAPADISPEALTRHLALAMAWANAQLAEWRAAREAEGRSSLAGVPASTLGGVSELATLYAHAVCCRAKSRLIWQSRPLSRSGSAKNTLDDADDTGATAGVWMQYAEAALAALQGKETSAVRLI